MQPLNFKTEFTLLTDLVAAMWTVLNKADFEQAARDAFNQGLHDGRFCMDENLTYRISKVINEDDEIECPLKDRRKEKVKGLSCAYIYDGLYNFNEFIRTNSKDVSNSQNRYGKWCFITNCDALLKRLKSHYNLSGLSPNEATNKEQNNFVSNFKGFSAASFRSVPTAERLTYRQAIHWDENQGVSYIKTLFAAIYSHGIACAEEQNNRTLVSVLAPIYTKYRTMPINPDNGLEILELAKSHEMITLFAEIKAPDFSSSKVVQEDIERSKKRAKMIANETPIEKDLRIKNEESDMESFTSKLLDELSGPEYEENEKRVEERLCLLIESFRDKLSVYAI